MSDSFMPMDGGFAPYDDRELSQLRVPPHSIEAESSVLGGLLLDNNAWERVGDLLAESDFYRHDHQLIYASIAKLINANKPADVITVSEQLHSTGKSEEVGGLVYLNALAQYVPSASNIRRYAEIVRDRSILRKLVTVSDEIATNAFNPKGRPVDSILDEAERKIFQINEEGSRTKQGFQSIESLVVALLDRVEEMAQHPNDITGVATGFIDLDKMTSGLQAGDMVVLAARPSMGKTALVVNIAEHVAMNEKLPVAIFSMEMSAAQLAVRILGSIAKIDQSGLRSGKLRDDEWPRLAEAVDILRSVPLHIDETPGLTPSELRANARRLARGTGGKLGLIVVDYLQLMSGSAGSQGENRATELGEISRGLKMLAKELQCPVIALSQLNRSVETRTDKRPMMSDLRECVTGDTLVWLADGRRVPIAKLVRQQPWVHAVGSNQKLVPAASDLVWQVGEKPVFKLNLASGRSLRATAKHRVMTGSGWKMLQDIHPGDRVALARQIPQPAHCVTWPEHALILLAHLVGDGSYLRGQPMRYTTASEDNSLAVTAAALAMGSTVQRIAGRGQWHELLINGNGNRWKATGVGAWLKALGIFNQRSHEKHLPAELLQLDDASIGLFLRHIWATDGCIHVRPAEQRGSHRIYFATCSETLARDVAALLLRLGIVARLRSVAQPNGNHLLWNVDVSGATAQQHFLTVVGAFGPRCAPAQALRERLASVQSNTNVDTLPIEIFAQVRDLMTEQGISQRAMAAMRQNSYGGTAHSSFSPSRAVLTDYAQHLGSADLLTWAESDLFWDQVVCVEEAGIEPVYDLTVPGPACWIANDGIVTHNSGAIEQDADIIMFIYRDDYYNKESKEPNVAEIIIGKQRNGPTGVVKLYFHKAQTRFESLALGSSGGGDDYYDRH